MRFEQVDFDGLTAPLDRLDYIMEKHGLIRAEGWDYERVTYDRKFEIQSDTYYLRVQAFVIEGDVGAHKATLQLLNPLLGKHYYPHGVEYGEGETFPAHLVEQCESLLLDIEGELGSLQQSKKDERV
ncbi:YugN family protein [Priestia filamentosa]|uniref:Uncharacterized protein n=1 Tax=Priestia filamentosa TaxID=1402861 RepID=A0A1X7F0Y1_9BACI|nr:YugN family protein [Priestia filamentosa]AKO91583.1 hypothetical protein BEH_05375 [Priestia filamentosa]MDT3761687.1 YugN family protein [Priestia filamentosa]OXS67784.1 hypothetical protein B1B01_14495 [Priestia filamentosa]RJS65013.1 hypothetical protein CJ485_09690 [Priestia filamentosa]WCM16785.1 YugN family protein [Priestia filamentosa]